MTAAPLAPSSTLRSRSSRTTRRRSIVIAGAIVSLGLGVQAVRSAPAVVPDDPYWPSQWGPRQIRADQAWAVSTGAGATIAIVDSGVDVDHPDLRDKLVPGATFFFCENPDEPCGAGRWEDPGGLSPDDPLAAPSVHGTHVAGIAAGGHR